MSTETRTGLIRRGSGESADVLGIRVIFLVTKEMSGGAFSLFRNIARRGARVPLHTHRHDHETMVVQRGRIVCRVKHETFTAQPGDTVHMPAGFGRGLEVRAGNRSWCARPRRVKSRPRSASTCARARNPSLFGSMTQSSPLGTSRAGVASSGSMGARRITVGAYRRVY